MKNALMTMVMALLFIGCQKPVTEPLKPIRIDYASNPEFINSGDALVLPDNTFWIRYDKPGNNLQYGTLFYNFDENLRLLDTVHFDDYYQIGGANVFRDKIYMTYFRYLSLPRAGLSIYISERDAHFNNISEVNVTPFLGLRSNESVWSNIPPLLSIYPNGDIQLALKVHKADSGRTSFTRFTSTSILPPLWNKSDKFYNHQKGWFGGTTEVIQAYDHGFYALGETFRKYSNHGELLFEKGGGGYGNKLTYDPPYIVSYHSYSTSGILMDTSASIIKVSSERLSGAVSTNIPGKIITTHVLNSNDEKIKDVALRDNQFTPLRSISIAGIFAKNDYKGTKGVLRLPNGKYVVWFDMVLQGLENKLLLVKLDENLNIVP